MKKFNDSKLFLPIAFVLVFSLLTISVGFSSLSTSLTVNGSSRFTPVDMLRITKIEVDSTTNAEIDVANHTIDSINTLVELTSLAPMAGYFLLKLI